MCVRKMKKLILLAFVAFGCTRPIQVCDTFNSSYCSDTCALIDTKIDSAINIPEARTITYFLNSGCSICLADFCTFIRSIDDFAFDSLVIVAGDAYDFIQPEFYLNREGLHCHQTHALSLTRKAPLWTKCLRHTDSKISFFWNKSVF